MESIPNPKYLAALTLIYCQCNSIYLRHQTPLIWNGIVKLVRIGAIQYTSSFLNTVLLNWARPWRSLLLKSCKLKLTFKSHTVSPFRKFTLNWRGVCRNHASIHLPSWFNLEMKGVFDYLHTCFYSLLLPLKGSFHSLLTFLIHSAIRSFCQLCSSEFCCLTFYINIFDL